MATLDAMCSQQRHEPSQQSVYVLHGNARCHVFATNQPSFETQMLKILTSSNEDEPSTFTVDVSRSKFPAGEIYVKLHGFPLKYHLIIANLQSSDDIMELLLVVNALREFNPKCTIDLDIPYVPYQQQDRVVGELESNSIKVFSSLINMCDFREVRILDPHSDVTPALIKNCVVSQGLWKFAIEKFNPDVLIAPDAGAYKKVSKIADKNKLEVITATKKRSNGEIVEGELLGDVNGKRCLVIDDICVGGATFIQLGNLLKNGGAKEIALYVSHGIFSKGTDKINLYYNKIYTTNSFDFKKQNPNNDFTGVTVL